MWSHREFFIHFKLYCILRLFITTIVRIIFIIRLCIVDTRFKSKHRAAVYCCSIILSITNHTTHQTLIPTIYLHCLSLISSPLSVFLMPSIVHYHPWAHWWQRRGRNLSCATRKWIGFLHKLSLFLS
jgi:hypothetical protein